MSTGNGHAQKLSIQTPLEGDEWTRVNAAIEARCREADNTYSVDNTPASAPWASADTDGLLPRSQNS